MQVPVPLSTLCSRTLASIGACSSTLQGLLWNSHQSMLGANLNMQQGQHIGSSQPAGQTRHMAVWVSVQDNDVTSALRKLNRKLKDSGLLEELRWRQHHIRKSDMRFHARKQAWNNEMARRITQKLYWLRKRKYVSE